MDFNKNLDGLLPVIIQDDISLQVLMLGYMNQEAYHKTIKEKIVTFFSRSRHCLWTKGETSGNFLFVQSILEDCDQDTLLIRVIPKGPTCHTGNISCFPTSNTEGFIRQLEHIIQQRYQDKPEGSYTTQLFKKGINKIAQKVGEEAVETVIDAVASNHEGMLYEASDLVYHLMVLLTATGYSISDIEKELAKRHKPSNKD